MQFVRNVSIPLWCDWKFFSLLIPQVVYLFQFLYGAIGSVQLFLFLLTYIHVSIPLWCDWKLLATFRMLLFITFQFLYGAIGSRLQLLALPIRCYVSIPLWCDWKVPWQAFSIVPFPVSIPLWCDWKPCNVIKKTKPLLVSVALEILKFSILNRQPPIH